MFFDIEKNLSVPGPANRTSARVRDVPACLSACPQHKPKMTRSQSSGDDPEQTTTGSLEGALLPPGATFRLGPSDPFSALRRGGIRGVQRTPRCPVWVPGL